MSTDSYIALHRDPKTKTAPLLFAFHGTGGDERQFFTLASKILPEAGVISPRGDVSEHGAARFFRRTGEGIYDMADLARATEQMVRFITAHKDAHPNAPVYGFGYSNGANILASVLMKAPDLFDRAGLLHPLVPWDPAPVPELSDTEILISAGRHDPICPWQMTEKLDAWFQTQGAEVSLSAHDGGHEIRQTEIDDLVDFLTR